MYPVKEVAISNPNYAPIIIQGVNALADKGNLPN